LRLLSKNDEYLLMMIFSKHVFKGDILSDFFLGYCQNEA
jgi:hypothetical protein